MSFAALEASSWECGGDTAYIHDEVASDKRDPTVNAGGPIYGVEFANDKLVWVEPGSNRASEVALPVRDTPGEGDFRSYIAQDMEIFLVLRRRADLDQPWEPAQPDDGRPRARLDDPPDSGPWQPRLVSGRLEQPVYPALSAGPGRPSRRLLRPGHRRGHAHRHVL